MDAVLIPGCDFTKNSELGAETKGRCRKTAKRVLKTENRSHIILTAGIFPGLKKPLAELMKDFLIGLGIEESRIISRGLAKNTEGEIDVAYRIVRERNFDQVEVVSSWYHLLRIWWYWRKKGIRVRVVPSFLISNPIEVYAESLKFLLALVGLKKPKVAGAV